MTCRQRARTERARCVSRYHVVKPFYNQDEGHILARVHGLGREGDTAVQQESERQACQGGRLCAREIS